MADRSKVAYEQAVEQYLAARVDDKTCDTTHLQRIKLTLGEFKRVGSFNFVDSVMRHHLVKWEGKTTRPKVSAVRCFLRWCNDTYGMVLPLPPELVRGSTKKCRAFRPGEGAGMRARAERALAAAPLMVLPHQKLIYLCGYLYALPLSRLVKITAHEIGQLRPMREDFYELLEALQIMFLGTAQPALRRWLGGTRSNASDVWRTWAPGVHFNDVIVAGNLEKVENGVKPICGWKESADLYFLLPSFDEGNMGRIRRVVN